jgi:polyisoprenoid-binding protein YceI
MKSLLLSLTLTLSAAAYAAPVTMAVDTAASEVKWTGSKVIGDSHNGTIKLSSGTVTMNGKTLTGGEFVIDMNTINNADLAASAKDKAKLEGHLKSDDFFGVAKNPTATFKITAAKANTDKKKKHTHDVTGDLTLKGITQSMTVPATITTEKDMATAMAAFEFDRTKFDVRFGSKNFFENLAGDRVINNNIKMDVKLVAKTATTPAPAKK